MLHLPRFPYTTCPVYERGGVVPLSNIPTLPLAPYAALSRWLVGATRELAFTPLADRVGPERPAFQICVFAHDAYRTVLFSPAHAPLANRASKLRLNAAAASALSITIKSLSCRLRPDAEKFAAPVRQLAVDLVALEVHRRGRLVLGQDLDALRLRQMMIRRRQAGESAAFVRAFRDYRFDLMSLVRIGSSFIVIAHLPATARWREAFRRG